MLYWLLRTKEGKSIIGILLLTAIIIGVFIYSGYSENKKYEEQTVMAEQYLEDGNYERAVEAYLSALSMKNSDQELLSIGLAEAYIGVNNYDKALDILRVCYQKTSGNRMKEKIEEVSSRKTGYEYHEIISRAEKYFLNKEYDKAIKEYEKAKLIKSKEVTSYQRIAEAYIARGEYNMASDELQEGLAITQNEKLNKTMDKVNSLLAKQQYDAMVTEATEYIYQENYEDGIICFNEAIKRMPKEEQAYAGLAEAYLTLEEYQKIIALLQEALDGFYSGVLEDLLGQAIELKELKEERKKILSDLYKAMDQLETDKIISLMNTSIFQEEIATQAPMYYSPWGEGYIKTGDGMIINDSKNLYLGNIKEGIKKGRGVYFIVTEKQGYYYYEGEWNNDIPNGSGKTVEVDILKNKNGEKEISKTVTRGDYYKGTENGLMEKYFYLSEVEVGNTYYNALQGIPVPYVNEEGQRVPVEEGESYIIGRLYLNEEPTDEYYSFEPNTIWGVKSFIEK